MLHSEATSTETADKRVKRDVIIVVHGIGQQSKYETLQEFVFQFGRIYGVPTYPSRGELAQQLQHDGWHQAPGLPAYGFTEVHWSHIGEDTRDAAIPDIAHWAARITHRLEALDYRKTPQLYESEPLPIAQIQAVMADTVLTGRLLRFLLSRVRVETEGMAAWLRAFVASYQDFVDDRDLRQAIVGEFVTTLRTVEAQAAKRPHEDIRIHIFAHSLGSLVAVLGLFELLEQAGNDKTLSYVESLCTVGSPLDFFATLHDDLMPPLLRTHEGRTPGLTSALRSKPAKPILWSNLVEVADPIASTTQVLRKLIQRSSVKDVFESSAPVDYTLANAFLPGIAHTAYWSTPNILLVFRGHSLNNGMAPRVAMRKQLGRWSSMAITGLALTSWVTTGGLVVLWAERFGLVHPPDSSDGMWAYIGLGCFVSALIAVQVCVGSALRSRNSSSILVMVLGPAAVAGLVVFLNRASIAECTHKSIILAFGAGIALTALIQCVGEWRGPWRRGWSFASILVILFAVNIVGVALASVPELVGDRPPVLELPRVFQAVILSIAIAITWWLSTLFFRFLVVWNDVIAGRRHIDALADRWITS